MRTTRQMAALMLSALNIVACSGNHFLNKSANDERTQNSTSPFSADTSSDNKPADDHANPPGYQNPTVPVPITGTNLTELSCSVTNQNDQTATDTTVSCKIKTDHGDKFSGKIENIIANLVTIGSTTESAGIVTILDPTAADSFVVIFAQIKPTDALGIKASASLDGAEESWVASLRRDSASTTIANMDLYVDAASAKINSACTMQSPCASIQRAIFFIPDIVAHQVNIHVANGDYHESIVISGKTLTGAGTLNVSGETAQWNPSTSASIHLKGDSTKAGSVGLALTDNSGPAIEIVNMDVDSCFVTGYFARKTTVHLSNSKISDCGTGSVLKTGLLGVQGFVTLIGGFSMEPTAPVSIGIYMLTSAKLIINANIVLLTPLSQGVLASDKSEISFGGGSEVLLTMKKADYGVHIMSGSLFQDFQTGYDPSATNRGHISIADTVIGIAAEKSQFIAEYADIAIAYCTVRCLTAFEGGKIAIGRDIFYPEGATNKIVSKLSLNSVPSTGSLDVAAAEGFIGMADSESVIDLLPTIEFLSLCHSSANQTAAFLANRSGSIFLGTKQAVGASLSSSCADKSIGRVEVNLGKISIAHNSKIETICNDGESFSTCLARSN